MRDAGVDSELKFYNVALIQLDGTSGDEPVRLLSNILDAWDIGDLTVGQPVWLECVKVGIATLPCFRANPAHAQ